MATPMRGARRFALDSSYRRPGGGRVVIAGSPLRLFTVSEAGARVLTAVEQGAELPPRHERLTDRLVDAGALHPVLPPAVDTDPETLARLTVVVPVHGEPPLIGALSLRTIVVDDAGEPPVTVADAQVVRLEHNVGPGGARNAGLALVDTEFVAFVDADVEIDQPSLVALLGHFDDPRVALVAPRVRPIDAPGPLAAFELRHSPLDRGAEPGRIAPTTRVSFVPAAALVCRTAALREVGGFDATMRYGEDVDLVWRLVAAGHRCRYEPSVIARHRVRSTLRSWVQQRVSYGSSAAPLAERHPGALAPFRMSGWSAAGWTAVAAGLPVAGLTIGVGTAVALTRKLRSIPASESLRLAARGNLFAGRLMASAITRAWWPVAMCLALVSKRARRTLAWAVLVPAALDWRAERPTLDPARYLALRVLDDAAYGAGLWQGAIQHRSLAALRPSFEQWPPRGAAARSG